MHAAGVSHSTIMAEGMFADKENHELFEKRVLLIDIHKQIHVILFDTSNENSWYLFLGCKINSLKKFEEITGF